MDWTISNNQHLLIIAVQSNGQEEGSPAAFGGASWSSPVDGAPIAVKGAAQRGRDIVQDASEFAQHPLLSHSNLGGHLLSQH